MSSPVVFSSAPIITSAHNVQVKEARKLNQRRYRHETQRMLIEGLRLVEDAWESSVRPQTVFFDPEIACQHPRVAMLVKRMIEAGIQCLSCTATLFQSLTETVTPQGIAAVVPLPTLPIPTRSSLILVLDRVRDPGNAGTLLRSAEAAGVDLVLIGPETVDPFNEKVVRAAMGSHFRLPLRVCEVWSDVMAYIDVGVPIYLAEGEATTAYDEVDWQHPSLLVVGGEAAGASVEARRVATPIAIPMLGRTESLNAAMAGTIMLFEAARQRRVKRTADNC